jgi:PTB domain (IRS-1 type)
MFLIFCVSFSFLFNRRYGVVDGRFCFEGGSACGKGEGLYIIITDVGEEITQTIKLAAQGQLALKKRPLVQKGASKSFITWLYCLSLYLLCLYILLVSTLC